MDGAPVMGDGCWGQRAQGGPFDPLRAALEGCEEEGEVAAAAGAGAVLRAQAREEM